jgi:hypothetical protein
MNRRFPTEFAAIPVLLVLFGAGLVLLVIATSAGSSWLLVGIPMLAVGLLLGWAFLSRRRASGDVPVAGVDGTAATGDGAYRALVITDESGAPRALVDQLLGNAADRRTDVLVIAPALSSRLARWTGDEKAYEDAERRLENAVRELTTAGIDAHGHIGAHDPLQAADDGVREFSPAEIVFVTNDDAHANWLEQGVVEAARERYALPVSQIVVPQ